MRAVTYADNFLWRRHNRECVHDAVGLLLADLANKQRPHTTSGTASQGMRHLESLEAVTVFRLFADDVEYRVEQLSALCVVTLGPVVAGAALPKHEVVRPEELPEWSRAHIIHGSRLKIQQDYPGYILAT
ncbi:hypothetical protein DPMN_151139 [Dreissena polymorpha]|uniref:Uncharacterized protein n=1 Tax=Dreissena polymorpha TaxID=45954 RepID=A0A9D4J2P3_DREPO|nr:hypothetical protein DPMN_151139 [Dreissena polymorpha]